MDACERAAVLVRQLLAYAGRGRFVLQAVDISQVAREAEPILRAAVPGNVSLRLELGGSLPLLEADAVQIQQLLTDLVTNAAEAIGEREGTITVSTSTGELDEEALRSLPHRDGIGPGKVVCLEVIDTGPGMDQSTLDRIFEPFFTTKFLGRGLGLPAALGIVRGHKGAIGIESTCGLGTRVCVYFPVAAEPELPLRAVAPAKLLPNGKTILLVDDEAMVRSAAKAVLERSGYSVLLAENGHEAVQMFERIAGDVALVILDLTMPVMGGEQAFDLLRRIRPDLRILLSSGYGERDATQHFRGKRLSGFIHKPYSTAQLLEEVKSVLGSGEPSAAHAAG
jgi:CheY-like chemotaxis protein